MSGFAGFLDFSSGSEIKLRHRVWRMAKQVVHRGPGGSGSREEVEAGVTQGFRRLAILDLSLRPVISPSEAVVGRISKDASAHGVHLVS